MRRLICLALVLVGCGGSRLHGVEGGLATSTRAVHFPLTYRGYPTQAGLKLTNTSPARIQIAIASALPFQSPATLELAGGESKELQLAFDPSSVGTFTAPITLSSGSTRIEVALDGEAREPSSCPATPCHHARFNPIDGTCITESDADGSACQSPDGCLTNASCRAGVCVGTEVSCDDHNACTADACSTTGGCVHLDQTASCPAPSDPCKVAACDPASGCGQADAPDGTVCGSVDCATAHLCFMGSCRAVTPPDGFECGPATPCQAHSTCQGGSCVAGVVTEMTPVWSVPAGGAWPILLPANARGELFWVEDNGQLADGGLWNDLVSVTSQGIPRFRVPTGGRAAIVVGDLVIVAANGFVTAFRQSDGQVAWRTPQATLDPSPFAHGGPYNADAIGISTRGLVATVWRPYNRNDRVTLTDPATGRTVATVEMSPVQGPYNYVLPEPQAEVRLCTNFEATPSIGIDARGNVTSQGQPLMVMTSTVTGGLEWTHYSDAGWNGAFALRSRSDGGRIGDYWPKPDSGAGDQPWDHPVVTPVVGDDIAFVSFSNASWLWSGTSVTGADPRSGQVLFEASLEQRIVMAPALTTRRSLLFESYDADGGHELDELDAAGRLTSTCPFSEPSYAYVEAVLAPEHWVRVRHFENERFTVESYAIRGISPASMNGGRSVLSSP